MPNFKTAKLKLQEKYGSNIVFSKIPAKKTCFTLRKSSDTDRILTDQWYSSREVDEYEEELRIVRTAANIIRKQVKTTIYGSSPYPLPEKFHKDVPNPLEVFLEGMISIRKGAFCLVPKD